MSSKYHQFGPRVSQKAIIKGKGIIEIGEFSVVSDYVVIDSGASPRSFVTIGKRCKIKEGVILRTYDGYIKIDDRVSIGPYTIIAGHGGVEIGRHTIIAGHCYISAQNHIFSGKEKIRYQGETAKGIRIGKDVWIGGNVVILDGVVIGNGCVIGAGSVVTKNLPPYTVCYGVPCRIIRSRIVRTHRKK